MLRRKKPLMDTALLWPMARLHAARWSSIHAMAMPTAHIRIGVMLRFRSAMAVLCTDGQPCGSTIIAQSNSYRHLRSGLLQSTLGGRLPGGCCRDASHGTGMRRRPMESDYHIRDATLADAPALADIVLESTIAAFHGRVPDQCLDWLTREESIANWQAWFAGDQGAGACLLVAEAAPGAQVVGCALGGPQTGEPDFAGELYLLGVLPTHQHAGLGRRLVVSVARRLAQHGIGSLGVRVLSANPNLSFYERLGGQYLREDPYHWNGVLLIATIYVWPDTAALWVED